MRVHLIARPNYKRNEQVAVFIVSKLFTLLRYCFLLLPVASP